MLRGMVTLLLDKGRIETTLCRAKELQRVADKMITIGKKQTLAAKRAALGYITKEEVVKKLFDIIAPKFEERKGGYTRVLKLGPRRGDGAEMAIIELVDYKLKDKKDKKSKKSEESAAEAETKEAKETKATKETKGKEEVKEKKTPAKRTAAKAKAKEATAADEAPKEVKKPRAPRKPKEPEAVEVVEAAEEAKTEEEKA
jgi:large subunit ribosomal protein L17